MPGRYKKAVIEIENKKAEEVIEKEVKNSVASSEGLMGFAGITQKLRQAAGNTLSEIVPGLGDVISGEKEQFEVQFNPAELEIEGNARIAETQNGTGKNHQNIDYGSLGSKIIVRIPLIFDKSLEMDSVASNVMYRTMKKDISVAGQVSDFLDAVRNPFARSIRFCWGNMIYKGQLASTAAEYTMFAKDGEPVRAKVTLEILCTDYNYG